MASTLRRTAAAAPARGKAAPAARAAAPAPAAPPARARGRVPAAPGGATPSPWSGGAERQRQRQAKREAVLSMAAQMFNERGFHATSLDDLAARLHVSKPTLYYYVKNKDEILLACVKKGLHMTLEGIEASRAAGGNVVDQLRACMRVYAGIVMQPFGMCLIRVGDEEVPEPSRTELRRMKSEIDLAFRRLVAQGVQEGSLAPCDPKMTAFVIAGSLSWIGRWYQPEGPLSAEAIAEQCIETLLGGVLARAVPAKASANASRPVLKKATKTPAKTSQEAPEKGAGRA